MALGKLRGAIVLKGTILGSGVHIGGGTDRAAPRSVDAPLVRHPMQPDTIYSNRSALKGKLRCLAENLMDGPRDQDQRFNRVIKAGEDRETQIQGEDRGIQIRRHECPNAEQAAQCPVCSMFGASADDDRASHLPHRLTPQVFEVRPTHGWRTEIKPENTLGSRMRPEANPRSAERTPQDTVFDYRLAIKVAGSENLEVILRRLNLLLASEALLEDDTLGGHGSRGFGKVRFTEIRMKLHRFVPPESCEYPFKSVREVQAFLRSSEGRSAFSEIFFPEEA